MKDIETLVAILERSSDFRTFNKERNYIEMKIPYSCKRTICISFSSDEGTIKNIKIK